MWKRELVGMKPVARIAGQAGRLTGHAARDMAWIVGERMARAGEMNAALLRAARGDASLHERRAVVARPQSADVRQRGPAAGRRRVDLSQARMGDEADRDLDGEMTAGGD